MGVHSPNPGAKNAHPGELTWFGETADPILRPAKSSKESIMRKRTNYVWFIGIIVVLVATLTLLGNAAAQKASVPKPQDKLAMGEGDVKHLLLLMDADKEGMVSKLQYMKYMEAEFERLDTHKVGQLNVKELTRSNLSATYYVGK
jgi:hypothetical protein